MQPDASNNVILVGPARSGTTLACSLLNDPVVANTAALDEPYDRDMLAAVSSERFLPFVEAQFHRFRRMLVEEGEAVSTVGDHGLSNHYDSLCSETGLRERVVSAGRVRLNKALDADCRLAVKHTIPFTAMLEPLRSRYPVYAIVRNPVAVLASWNSIDAAYRNGAPPRYAAHLCGDMPWLINAVRDRFERQVVLLAWHFEQYLPLLRDGKVIRYEDMIDSGGRALGIVSANAGNLSAQLANQNYVNFCDPELIAQINISLHRLGGVIWEFYDRKEVDGLSAFFTEGRSEVRQRK
ncbi:hypothetical protein [Emcibacter sp. SYSU 3D8]|uniref:hypothetical protein n=1 Tax=Emcibacter sp. SYSU 3D8 TaxID=3133969 RepID=UPI0031FE96F5